jgi:hypothetical protein
MGERPPFQGFMKRLRDVFQGDRSHSATIIVSAGISSEQFEKSVKGFEGTGNACAAGNDCGPPSIASDDRAASA